MGGNTLKLLRVILMLMMLSGCAAQQTWETVNDPQVEVAAIPRELGIKLPPEAAAPVLQSPEAGQLYLCNGYVLAVHTFVGGDLDDTMRQLTGFSKEQLACMKTEKADYRRYDCVWSSASDGGDQVGRAVILDDGNFHYAVSLMADFASAGDLSQAWQEILNSVVLTDTD